MKNRSRLALPFTAALLLGAALAVRFFLSAPEPAPSPAAPKPSGKAPVAQAPAPAPAPSPAPAKPEPVKEEMGPTTQLAEGRATVVPFGPGDHVPDIPPEKVSSEEDEPLLPEKSQTAAWKHQKTVRITELLERDVDRLEEERAAARARGDVEEARRLEVQLARHQARLGKLRDEAAGLAQVARDEPGE